MEMIIDFPGGERVDAHFEGFTVATDQKGAAPSPYQYFLASIGTCAGIYVYSFCQKRNLPTEGIRIIERINRNPETHVVDEIDLEIQVPPTFPSQYYEAVVRSAELCAVKKSIANPPKFNTYTKVVTTG
jgi:putative redox protein